MALNASEKVVRCLDPTETRKLDSEALVRLVWYRRRLLYSAFPRRREPDHRKS